MDNVTGEKERTEPQRRDAHRAQRQPKRINCDMLKIRGNEKATPSLIPCVKCIPRFFAAEISRTCEQLEYCSAEKKTPRYKAL